MTGQQFTTSALLRLDVENTITSGLKNLAHNPHGQYGGWGYLTPATNTAISAGGFPSRLSFATSANQAGTVYFASELVPVTPGDYVAGSLNRYAGAAGTSVVYGSLNIRWLDSSKATLSDSTATAASNATGPTAVYTRSAIVAPTGAAYAVLRVVVTRASGANLQAGDAFIFRDVRIVKASTAAAADPTTAVNPTYTNVLGSAYTIDVDRPELSTGTLDALIADAALDPSASTLLRPGKIVRLVTTASGSDVALFTGKLFRAVVDYDLTDASAKRAHIDLTAHDAGDPLANEVRASSVGTIAELPYVLEGCGVPWNVNGSGNQVPAATVLATSDGATAADQVVITRDTVMGYAWVNRDGVLNAWDRASISTTVAAVLDESTYSRIGVGYDTDQCINQVKVKSRKITGGATVETDYGPYVDQTSADDYGPHAAEFTVVQSAAGTGAGIATYAAAVLAANKTPQLLVNSMTCPLRTAAEVAAQGSLDLEDLVTASNTAATISQSMRVVGIKHSITASKWLVDFDLRAAARVARPWSVRPLTF